jgi:hypothetical protein
MHSDKLTRRMLLGSAGAGLAPPALLCSARAATPTNMVVMAKSIKDIGGVTRRCCCGS